MNGAGRRIDCTLRGLICVVRRRDRAHAVPPFDADPFVQGVPAAVASLRERIRSAVPS